MIRNIRKFSANLNEDFYERDMVHNTTSTPPDECGQHTGNDDQSYDLGLHIVSIFVIFILSLLGASISVISSRVKRFHISSIIINIGKFFGSGVVLATGFIHMLPAAMDALTDPCLPDGWKKYDAFAGLFAMIAAIIMQLIEYIAHQYYRSMNSNTSFTTNNIDFIDDREFKGHCHGLGFQDENRTNKISIYLLEFGIALHSVLIGLALGTEIDEFLPLFIALCFHQFFEGVALGAQLARLDRLSIRSAIFMVLFYAITTPLGIGIGIGVQTQAYNPKSVASLLVSGILDSVSAGILIYVALVNLIGAEMGCGAYAFHALSKRLKVFYFGALYAGAIAMAVVGLWA